MFRRYLVLSNTAILQCVRGKGFQSNKRQSFEDKLLQTLKSKAPYVLGFGISLATCLTIALSKSESSKETTQPAKKIKSLPEEKSKSVTDPSSRNKFKNAIARSKVLLRKLKEETGSPGLVCAVSIDGTLVWSTALGYSDVENGVKCNVNTLMRIASISKSLTAIGVGRLVQSGKLDLDASIHKYVPYYPEMKFDGKKVEITPRQLLCHTSGIRHYHEQNKDAKNLQQSENSNDARKYILPSDTPKVDEVSKSASTENIGVSTRSNEKQKESVSITKNDSMTASPSTKGESQELNRNLSTANDKESVSHAKENSDIKGNNKSESSSSKITPEFQRKEYLIKHYYKTTKEALELFQNDPLRFAPGTDYLYTTHGYTLLSAVVEGASGEDFVAYMKKICKDIGLENTQLEFKIPIVHNRSRYYNRLDKGRLHNCPYVDNSYKWAGGGFLSTAEDLVKVGNMMLYSYQADEIDGSCLPGYLKPSTVREQWTPVPMTVGKVSKLFPETSYGLGWGLWQEKQDYGYCRKQEFTVTHSGGAIGASSILLIQPRDSRNNVKDSNELNKGNLIEHTCSNCGSLLKDRLGQCRPNGIVVAIIVNMQEVSLSKAAFSIAEHFKSEL